MLMQASCKRASRSLTPTPYLLDVLLAHLALNTGLLPGECHHVVAPAGQLLCHVLSNVASAPHDKNPHIFWIPQPIIIMHTGCFHCTTCTSEEGMHVCVWWLMCVRERGSHCHLPRCAYKVGTYARWYTLT